MIIARSAFLWLYFSGVAPAFLIGKQFVFASVPMVEHDCCESNGLFSLAKKLRRFTHLRVSSTCFLKIHSHACIFISRIPATISAIRWILLSVAAAILMRSFPDRYIKNPPKGTRRQRKMKPINACQPMKCHSNGTTTQTSNTATIRRKNCLAASSILWTSLDTRSITWPLVNSLRVCWPKRRICRKEED